MSPSLSKPQGSGETITVSLASFCGQSYEVPPCPVPRLNAGIQDSYFQKEVELSCGCY